MTPSDLISIWQECPHLSQSQIDRFLAAGVSIEALSADPGHYGFAVASDLVAFEGCQFAFERHLRQPGECERAFIVPGRDQFGEIVDLIAWRAGQLATWCGRIACLGLQNLYEPRLGNDALLVDPDPLAWLRHDRRGVLIINPERAKWELASAGPLLVSTIEQGRQLQSALAHTPEILLPALTERLAA